MAAKPSSVNGIGYSIFYYCSARAECEKEEFYMKAVISAHSGIEGLEIREIPMNQKLGKYDVQIKIHAFGLNWRDYFKMTRLPWCRENPIPGSDASGEVVAVGEEVTRFKVGDKVITSDYAGWYDGLLTWAKESKGLDLCYGIDGCMQEYFTMHENGFVRMPKNLSWEEAGVISTTYGTSFNAVVIQGKVGLAQTVLIEGTGGLSTASIAFAKKSGARVIVMGKVQKGLDLAKELGADEIINTEEYPDWDKEVLELTDGLGVDVSIDILGKVSLDKCMLCTKQNGIVVLEANLTGGTGTFNMAIPLVRQLTLKGMRVASTEMMERMVSAMEMFDIKPPIDSIFELDRVQDAFQRLVNGVEFGKICVKVC
jgi:NADPH:quinone reductase-like Zn-dependent oxidoreductase